MHVQMVTEAQENRARFLEMMAEVATKLGFAYLGAHTWHDFTIWCFALGPIVEHFVTGKAQLY